MRRRPATGSGKRRTERHHQKLKADSEYAQVVGGSQRRWRGRIQIVEEVSPKAPGNPLKRWAGSRLLRSIAPVPAGCLRVAQAAACVLREAKKL
jgi:hypothetical protein